MLAGDRPGCLGGAAHYGQDGAHEEPDGDGGGDTCPTMNESWCSLPARGTVTSGRACPQCPGAGMRCRPCMAAAARPHFRHGGRGTRQPLVLWAWRVQGEHLACVLSLAAAAGEHRQPAAAADRGPAGQLQGAGERAGGTRDRGQGHRHAQHREDDGLGVRPAADAGPPRGEPHQAGWPQLRRAPGFHGPAWRWPAFRCSRSRPGSCEQPRSAATPANELCSAVGAPSQPEPAGRCAGLGSRRSRTVSQGSSHGISPESSFSRPSSQPLQVGLDTQPCMPCSALPASLQQQEHK